MFAIRMKKAGDSVRTINMIKPITDAVHEVMPLDAGSAPVKRLIDGRWKNVYRIKVENKTTVEIAKKQGKMQVLYRK